MGRQASIVKPGNRTRSTARAAENDDGSPKEVTFFRRFPRLGSAFQTKVPSDVPDSYQPLRKPPVLLSKEYPDVAYSDIEEDTTMDSGEFLVGCFLCLGV